MNFLFRHAFSFSVVFPFDQVKDKDFEEHNKLILNYHAHYRIDDLSFTDRRVFDSAF